MGVPSSFTTTSSFSPTSSFSSVSVRCRRAFSFKRRLTDTYVLGNLPKVGTGFGKVHASLREIPEGDEKYSRYRSLFFYHSRMTAITRHSRALVSVAAALFLLSGGLRTLASSGISLILARALLEFTVTLGRFPKAMKNMVACRLPIFLSFENDEVEPHPGYQSLIRRNHSNSDNIQLSLTPSASCSAKVNSLRTAKKSSTSIRSCK